MSGVTHFERRDRQKFAHAACYFCGKLVKGTPKALAGEKGNEFLRGWVDHITDHMLERGTTLLNLHEALRLAMSVAREHDRNK